MRKGRLFILMLCVCVILSFTLAACSSGKDNSSNKGKSAGNGQKNYAISYMSVSYGDPQPKDGAGLKAIDKKFNVKWNPIQVPYDAFKQRLATTIASGDIPDAIQLEDNGKLAKYAKEGMLLPLDKYIKQYPNFKNIPKFVWNAMTVNGHIYGIPNYFPVKYGKVGLIRKDWLDKLGLKMPTNYKQLKKVAIAFTKDDPDGDGKNDTYGLEIAKTISPPMNFGEYWDGYPWVKGSQGKYIPGLISQGSKKRIQFLRDLYQAGAIQKDWPTIQVGDNTKDFFSGKTGITMMQTYDIGSSHYTSLRKIDPKAQLAAIPPFKQPNGKQGYTGLSGYYELTVLPSSLKNDPGKVKRILSIINYFMKFIPPEQQNPKNKVWDWKHGHVGKGYKMVKGISQDISLPNAKPSGAQPYNYIGVRPWPAKDSDLELVKTASDPLQKQFYKSAANIANKYPFYISPSFRVISEVYNQKYWDSITLLQDDQTKMIAGKMPISDWNKMVNAWESQGGKAIIDDMNKKIQKAGIQGKWIK